MRHGPHHGAQRSTTTAGAASASTSNVWSVASTNHGSGLPQLPQCGAPLALGRILFFLPQLAQVRMLSGPVGCVLVSAFGSIGQIEDTLGGVEIENNEADRRWEVKLDGRVIAFAEYKSRPDRVTFTHTVVDPDFEGRGVGSRLARAALDGAISSGARITLYCPFIRAWVDRHPEYEQYIDPPKSRS